MTAELTADPSTFDPAAAVAVDDWYVDQLLFDTVLRQDTDGTIVGGLATEWDSKSASELELTIRDDATCADGTKIDAQVVADSLSYYANDPSHVSATTAFGPGKATITAEGDSTVLVKTSVPYADLAAGLTMPQSGVICPAGLDDVDGLKAGTVEGAFSGPYTLESSKPGVKYEFALRSDYEAWPDFSTELKGDPVQKYEFGILTDESTSANQVLSQNLDISSFSGTQIDRFKDQGFNIVDSISGNLFIVFNESEGRVFADKANRKAAAQAIDREAWERAFSDGLNPLWTALVPPTYACANEDASLLQEFDPGAAGKVLDGVKIKIVNTDAFGAQSRDSEYLQKALTNAGAEVDLRVEDIPSWAGTVMDTTADWDITIFGDGNQIGTIGSTMQRVMGPTTAEGGRSITSAKNPEGAKALKKANATLDEDARCDLYQTAQETMLERVDAIPLTGAYRIWVLPENASAVLPANNKIDFTTVRIEN